jgi:hypothetical protein
MENSNAFSEKGYNASAEEENLPVPNEPFEGENFNVTPDMEASESNDRYYEVFEKSKTKTMFWSVMSLVFGIASVALSIFGWVALSLGALAVIFAVVSRIKLGYFDAKTIVGMMLGIFGIVFGVVMVVWNSIFSENLFSAVFEKGNGVNDSGSGLNDI